MGKLLSLKKPVAMDTGEEEKKEIPTTTAVGEVPTVLDLAELREEAVNIIKGLRVDGWGWKGKEILLVFLAGDGKVFRRLQKKTRAMRVFSHIAEVSAEGTKYRWTVYGPPTDIEYNDRAKDGQLRIGVWLPVYEELAEEEKDLWEDSPEKVKLAYFFREAPNCFPE